MARLNQDKFRIFVSHKHADKELANLVDHRLTSLAPDLIECWVSGQDITAGMDWDREIKQQLAVSHLLILLFTTPAQEWDWCLFEVGLFTRFEASGDSAVVCLYDPDGAPPGPLKQVQGVRADADDLVTKFLRPLCTTPWVVADGWQRGPLVPAPDETVLRDVAQQIAAGYADAVAGGDEQTAQQRYAYRPCHRVVLDLEAAVDTGDWSGIPLDAAVVEGKDDTTSYTLSLFRAQGRKVTHRWRDLLDEAGGPDAPWRRDVDQQFVDGLRGKLFMPSSEVIEVWQPPGESRRAYRPVIYEIDRRESDDVPVRVTILLVPTGAH